MFGLLKTIRVGCAPILLMRRIIFGNDRGSQHFELEREAVHLELLWHGIWGEKRLADDVSTVVKLPLNGSGEKSGRREVF
jgi:hypothetical protein